MAKSKTVEERHFYITLCIKELFYEDVFINGTIDSIKIFDELTSLEKWKNKQAKTSRTKYIFPFCWQ
ncbi:MAG: hypothetical protein UHO63_11035, partial [Blautia sp.]|nr:hypothetical protein [Blautia sp.]